MSRSPVRSLWRAIPCVASIALCACAGGSDAAPSAFATDAAAPRVSAPGCEAGGAPCAAVGATGPAPSASETPASADGAGDGDDGDDGDDGPSALEASELASDAASGSTSTSPSATPPAPGDLAITEVMFAPSGPEPQSEWFEIYNRADTPRLLSGLTIEDGYLDTLRIASIASIASSPALVVPPLTYVVLARDRAAALRAQIPAAAIVYEYGAGVDDFEGIELDAGGAGELSLWNGDTLLADVPYGMWDAAFAGQSIELADPGSAGDVAGNWCLAENPWGAGSDDGTPGAPNDCSP